MNSSDSGQNQSPFVVEAQIVGYCAANVAAVVIVAMIFFVTVFESYSSEEILQEPKFDIKNTLTSINKILLLMGLSVIVIEITNVIYVLGYPFSHIVMFSFVATFEVCYIAYSWKRSSEIFRYAFPQLFSLMKWAVWLSPFILYLQVIPQAIDFIQNPQWSIQPPATGAGPGAGPPPPGQPQNSPVGPPPPGNAGPNYFILFFPAASGCFSVLYDILFLYAFMYYIHKNRKNSEVDMKFQIISVYGAIACFFSLLTVVLYFLSFTGTTIDQSSKFYSSAFGALPMPFITLCFMKLATFWNQTNERSKMSELIRTRGKSRDFLRPQTTMKTQHSHISSVRSKSVQRSFSHLDQSLT
ncbi:hypothetical protein HDU83_002549 [Entophlyctis luteolus]|nr:hypothetical protein HDU83_002549 [Entophlyctis luteolus]